MVLCTHAKRNDDVRVFHYAFVCAQADSSSSFSCPALSFAQPSYFFKNSSTVTSSNCAMPPRSCVDPQWTLAHTGHPVQAPPRDIPTENFPRMHRKSWPAPYRNDSSECVPAPLPSAPVLTGKHRMLEPPVPWKSGLSGDNTSCRSCFHPHAFQLCEVIIQQTGGADSEMPSQPQHIVEGHRATAFSPAAGCYARSLRFNTRLGDRSRRWHVDAS